MRPVLPWENRAGQVKSSANPKLKR